MGGAAGHMAHPFDCREVRNGRDLINFYVKAVNNIPLYQGDLSRDDWLGDFGGVNPTSVKFDGVNASFRLEKANTPAGFMFVHDRGAKSDKSDVGKIDYAGITSDNAHERFPKPGHGMVYVVKIMSKILNHDLMKVKPYIEALGIFENGIGPEGVTFNAEFYSNEDPEKEIRSIKNVTDYNQNFIAIHNLQDFHTEETITKSGKVTTSRKTRGYYWQAEEEINKLLDQKDQLQTQGHDAGEIDALIAEKNQDLDRRRNEHQEIINKFAKALEENANALDLPFNVHTQVGLQFKEGISRELVLKRIEGALDEELSYNYKKMAENMSVGPTKINEQTGEVEPRTLKDFLMAIKQNPAHTVYYPEEFKKTKSDGSQAPATADIKVKPEFSQRHANKAGKPLATRQSAFAKKIYDDIIVTGPETGIGVADVAADDGVSFEAVNSAVILWEAVKRIGNVLKESVLSKEDFGLPMSEQEGIVIQTTKICDGIPFKFTGEFIVTGGQSEFRKDIPQPLNETKLKYGELLESFMVEAEPVIEQKRPLVILIPGGFKPPTNGHFSMIQQYEKRPDVSKVIVVTGFKPRKEPGLTVTHEQSKAIFDIYGGFGDKVEFRDQGRWPTPMRTCYEYVNDEKFVSEFPGAVFALGASDKEGDKERISAFYNHFQKKPSVTKAQVVNYPPANALEVDGEAASATRMRKAFVSGDWDTFKKLMHDDSQYDDVVQVLNQQGAGGQGGGIEMERGGSMVAENFLSKGLLFSLVDEVLLEDKKPSETSVKKAERGLKAAARKKGFEKGSEEWNRYVYGGKRNIGWKPKRELSENNGESWTEPVAKFDGTQESEIRTILQNLINKFAESEIAPELKVASGAEKSDINTEEVKQKLFTAIMPYIDDIFASVVTEEEMNEISSMGAGMVEIGAGGAWDPDGDKGIYEEL
jgi:hypothetical protein